MTFPRLIHYIYWDFKGENRPIPAEWIRNIHRNYDICRQDGWHYQIWNQQDSFELIRHCIDQYCRQSYVFEEECEERAKAIYETFCSLPGVVQTDLIRVGIIYCKGGIYCDASDIILSHSLEHLVNLASGCHFHVEYFEPCLSIGNASFGAMRHHHVIAELLELLIGKLDVCDDQRNQVVLTTQEDVYAFAGPKALTEYILNRYAFCPLQMRKRMETHLVSVVGLGDGSVSIFPPKMLIGWGINASDAVCGIHAFKGTWKMDIPSEEDMRGRAMQQQISRLPVTQKQRYCERSCNETHRMMIDQDSADALMVDTEVVI